MSTRFIAFEGIDGSGKTLQIEMLSSHLRSKGNSVQEMSFPRYDEGFFGPEIGKLLSDKRKPNALELGPKDMSLWYALDRFDQMRGWRSWEYDYVLLNRFTLSNVAFQGSRLQPEEDEREFENWLDTLEHVIFGLPYPDVYIIFDVSPLQSRINVGMKGDRDYVGGEADLHERDEDFQGKVRSKYKMIAEEDESSVIIDCISGDGMRTEEDIHDEVLKILNDFNMI